MGPSVAVVSVEQCARNRRRHQSRATIAIAGFARNTTATYSAQRYDCADRLLESPRVNPSTTDLVILRSVASARSVIRL
jgi:hypothetical protein